MPVSKNATWYCGQEHSLYQKVSVPIISTSTSASSPPPWGVPPQGSAKGTRPEKAWALPEGVEQQAPQLEQTMEEHGDQQPCSHGGRGPGRNWAQRPHLWASHTGLLLPPPPRLPPQGLWVGLTTSISPPTSSLIGNPSAAARARAAFFLPANKMFRSFSPQRPRFLSHYLPHRQPSLLQTQDFVFLFIFMVPLFMGYLFS